MAPFMTLTIPDPTTLPAPAPPFCIPDCCCCCPLSVARGDARLALFGGILSGSASRLSLTGSTIAVRPDAPFHPGLLATNAAAAGSVWLIGCCCLGPRGPASARAVLDSFRGGICSGDDGGLAADTVEMPKPCTRRPSLGGLAGVAFCLLAATCASFFCRRSRRIIGMLDRVVEAAGDFGRAVSVLGSGSSTCSEGTSASRLAMRRCEGSIDWSAGALLPGIDAAGGRGACWRDCIAAGQSSSSSMGEISW